MMDPKDPQSSDDNSNESLKTDSLRSALQHLLEGMLILDELGENVASAQIQIVIERLTSRIISDYSV